MPGYDEIAQQIATAFPEYATDDGTQRLWDFLFSPYDKMPSRYELIEEALELADQSGKRKAESGHDGFPLSALPF